MFGFFAAPPGYSATYCFGERFATISPSGARSFPQTAMARRQNSTSAAAIFAAAVAPFDDTVDDGFKSFEFAVGGA